MARTRSSEAHEKVLNATGELIAELGVGEVSMDAVARLSGVSKATIYKHWADKEALCLETARRMIGVLPNFHSDNPREDVIHFLRHLTERRKAAAWGRIWPRIMSYSMNNPSFGRALKTYSIEPQRAQLKRILKRAIDKRELHSDLDTDVALSLLVGPIMHCGFFKTKVPTDFIEQVVDAFWKMNAGGKGARSQEPGARR
jgi:AcrR family transcriptional regulator